jgi:hypothetical protein
MFGLLGTSTTTAVSGIGERLQGRNKTSEGNTMELTTDEIIARLMNLSVKLDEEMRFEEGSTVSQAIALIMTMRNAAERMRHPSMSYNDEMKAIIEWIVEPK